MRFASWENAKEAETKKNYFKHPSLKVVQVMRGILHKVENTSSGFKRVVNPIKYET
jgi:hypothetical protein